MAASKKTVVAVASGVFALAAGIGVAGLASADPTATPSASPTGAPSAGPDQSSTDRPGLGHRGPGRGAHGRFDGDLTAKLAEKLGVTEDKVTTALKEIRDANKPDPDTLPDPGTKPDPSARDAELAGYEGDILNAAGDLLDRLEVGADVFASDTAVAGAPNAQVLASSPTS